jgi:hypothetical protein
MAATNMSRPNRGLIGIRLEPSDEFGPTGEERYGSNMFGRVMSDLDRLMEGLKEGDIIYVREIMPAAPAKKATRKPKAPKAKSEEAQPVCKNAAKAKKSKSRTKGEENGQG